MRRLQDQRGSSLMEVVTVVAILSLALGAIYQFLIVTQRTTAGVEARLENLAESRVALAEVSRDMRTATRLSSGTSPFSKAGNLEVEFYASVDPDLGPKKIRLYIDSDGNLKQDATKADAGSGPNWTYTGDAVTRTLARWISNPGTRPVFVYYDGDSGEIASPLSATDRLKIHAVKVELTVRKPSLSNEPAVTLANRIRLPNVFFNPLPSPTP